MEKDPCPVCKGGGKVDSKDGKPWKEVTATRNPEVLSGEVTPRDCEACRGTGKKDAPESKDPAAAVAAPDMHQIPAAAPNSPATAPAPAAAVGTLPPEKSGGTAAKRRGAGASGEGVNS